MSFRHNYEPCCSCTDFAFKYTSDKIQHEKIHLPISCSICEQEFPTFCSETLDKHYKKDHQSFVCKLCPDVISFSDFPEHAVSKHKIKSFATWIENSDNIFKISKSVLSFKCRICGKIDVIRNFYPHFIKNHQLSIQSLKKYLNLTEGLQFSVCENESENRDLENKCIKCKKEFGDISKEFHQIFCQGYLSCLNRECYEVFENETTLSNHIDTEHQPVNCKFGCEDILLNPEEVSDHFWESHGIVECFLCNIVKGTSLFDDHLYEVHKVVGKHEEGIRKNNTKLFRAENENGE